MATSAAELATYVCAWCGGEGATLWLCATCDRTPWSKGGARYVLRRRYQESGNRHVLRVIDRAYLYTAVPYEGPRPHAYLRDLNHAARRPSC